MITALSIIENTSGTTTTNRVHRAYEQVNDSDLVAINIEITDRAIDVATNQLDVMHDDRTATVTVDGSTIIIVIARPTDHPRHPAKTTSVIRDTDSIDAVIDDGVLNHALRDKLLNRGVWIDTGTGIELPSEEAIKAITDARKWQQHVCDRTDDGTPRSIDDLPDNTKWVDGHPAPAVGDEHGGRPPTGYAVSNGVLTPHPDKYVETREALVAADDNRVTQGKAATTIGVSETTVKRILHEPERRRRYALDVRVE